MLFSNLQSNGAQTGKGKEVRCDNQEAEALNSMCF